MAAPMPPIPEVAYRMCDDTAGLELSLLPTFATLVDLRSFARTAHAHGLARSTVLKRIRTLERITGERLYCVRGKRVELTAAGQNFSKYTARVLATRVQRTCNGLAELTIASTSTIAALLLGPAIERVATERRAHISLVTGTEDEVLELARKKSVDIAVVSGNVEGFLHQYVAQVKPIVVARAGCEVVERNVVTSAVLQSYRVFTTGDLADHLLDSETVESAEVALSLAAAGIGVAVVDGIHRDRATVRVATIRDLPPKVFRVVHTAAWRSGLRAHFAAALIEDVRRRFGKQKPKTECLAGS